MQTLVNKSEYTIVRTERGDVGFYDLLGPIFGSRAVAKELGMPVYDDDNRVWFVVIDAQTGEAVACASYELLKTKGKAAVKSGWVHSDWRGKGIYDQLIDLRLEELERIGIKTISGTVTAKSKDAFLARGFRVIAERGKYFNIKKGPKIADNI